MHSNDVLKYLDGTYADSNGLFLVVKNNGNARSWLFRCTYQGKRIAIGLGSVKTVNLNQARKKRDKFNVALGDGQDPREVFKDKKVKDISFRAIAEEAIQNRQTVNCWSNDVHARQWQQTLRDYVYPVIGKKSIAKIDIDDVLQILKPIWFSKSETAYRVRGRIAIIIDYAIAMGYRDLANPARWKGYLSNFLPSRQKVTPVKHMSALSVQELQQTVTKLLEKNSIVGRAIIFGALTASRCQEFCGAKWEEFDFDKKIWYMPPERRKDKKPYPHRVPLTDEMIALVQSLERVNEYVFRGWERGHINLQSPRVLLREVSGSKCTMHGCRSTFRDWAAETGEKSECAEKALSHSSGSEVIDAYQRSDLLELRRDMMERWSKTLIKEKLRLKQL